MREAKLLAKAFAGGVEHDTSPAVASTSHSSSKHEPCPTRKHHTPEKRRSDRDERTRR